MTYVQQLDESDCGAACLAMIATHYNHHTHITSIRNLAGTDRIGTTLAGMSLAAEKMNFDVKALEGDKDALTEELPMPFIAHVNVENCGIFCDHYVIVRKIRSGKVYYWDPNPDVRKKKVTIDEFAEIWTGYVLFLSPGLDFKPDKSSKNTLLKFLPLLKPYTKTLVLAGISSIILVFLGILSAMYSRYIIDEVLFAQAKITLISMSIGMILLIVIQTFIGVSRQMLLMHFSFKVDMKLVFTYFFHVLNLPMNFFDSRKTGEILQRMGDASKIRSALSGAVLSVVMDTLMIIVIGPVLFFMNSTLFWIILITVPLTSILFFIYSRIYRKRYREMKVKGAELQSFLVESINGAATVKSLNAQNNVFEEYERQTVDLTWTSFNTAKLGMSQGVLTQVIQGVGSTLLFWLGSLYIIDGVFTLGTLISFTALSGYFLGPLQRLINLQASLQEAVVSADRLSEILDLDQEEVTNENLLKPAKFLGHIEFKDILFRYGTRKPVFESLSLSVPAGSRVAFVGPSGSGKTTLAKLLLKMYVPEDGDILIDGHDIKDLEAAHLRSRVGYVPQEIFLFSGSVSENIALHKPDADIEEVIQAAKRTGAHDFIENLPERYDTKLGERGSSLSGGQRQRLALARAIMGKPELLIFDEATSNLDSLSEHFIHETIDSLKEEKVTTIIIAHRLTTVTNCDTIFVLDNGELIQSGTHKELKSKKGLYKSLWEGTSV